MNCVNCGAETTNPKYCSRSCSQHVNNLGKRRYGKEPSNCLCCGVRLKGSISKFCSGVCQHAYEFDSKYESWLRGVAITGRGGATTPAAAWFKKCVIRRDGYECSVCHISEWQGGLIGLELEHKNGDSGDNSPENVCLLCPNCHSQTPTFKAKNRGFGRFSRVQRMREGKSY
jgi:hypothetical protein